MKDGRVLYHMVRADFLERTRRYSFLLTLAFACYLAYGAGTGHVALRLDNYQGILNSAWCGSMMTLVTTCFLSLVGFYVVKNSVLRDEQTRVGQILAATPMTRSFYTLAKTISNFVVLAAMTSVLAVAAVVIQLAHANHYPLELGTLLAPFVFVALPALAVTAAVAVLFETVPGLRGGIGNVVFFFLWGAGLGVGISNQANDFVGFNIIGRNMQTALKAIDPNYKNDITLTVANSTAITHTFPWYGVHWTWDILSGRLMWAAIAVGIAWMASLFFHRFDPAKKFGWKMTTMTQAAASGNGNGSGERASAPSAAHVQLTPLAPAARGTRFPHLVVSELRLMLKGKAWWWYVAAAGLVVAQLATPGADARYGVLMAAWLWPILVWSQMGSREARYSTQSLIFPSERSLYRQLPAVWAAGVLVALLTGGGVGIRLLISRDIPGFEGWLMAALFIPSLSLALGVWSGSSKFFEALYTAWWYVGPLHHTPGLDFMGVTSASRDTLWYGMAAVGLLAVAYFGRRFRLAYV